MGWVIFGSFFLLLLIGVPIGLAIGLSALIVFLAGGLPLQMVPQTLLEGNNSFALVAVPFFILAGDLLARGDLGADRGLRRGLPGAGPGGLSIISAGSMFIAAISGSGRPPPPRWAPPCCRS
jgi:C4-dicarboxylate transporter DctM subunit